MISKADVIERLSTLIGEELTSEKLHEGLFCEDKHQKIRRRFHFGTHTYVTYTIHLESDQENASFAAITIPGNPNSFRVGLKEVDGKLLINSAPRINYSYL
ncbi:hypothetical protein [Bacillus sp. PS06]|uniref:hypothetical protein n=1 Tax=Bacillus sp. PS06 TaxID=2764176 RepID=UPI00177F7036|nr:hypothetical protein [Bacillus sp. PS06]MBD8068683.1 hypothetical protein [Bacillus sp. PS06]